LKFAFIFDSQGWHRLCILQLGTPMEMQTPTVSGLSPQAPGATGKSKSRMWEVSKQFESLFMDQLFKSMRRTVGSASSEEGGKAQALFTEMLDTEYASQAAGQSPQGLASQIFKFLQQQGLNPDSSDSDTSSREDSLPAFLNSNSVEKYLNPGKGMEGRGYTLPGFRTAPPDQTLSGSLSLSLPALGQGFSLEGVSARVRHWQTTINQAQRDYQLPPGLLEQVIQQESGGNPKAQSPAGAKGLMQIMDGTAKSLGIKDVWDPVENIKGGARYLQSLLGRYKGDLVKTLAAYNAGPGRVEQYQGVPPFKETQNYIKKILSRMNMHQNQHSGGFNEVF